MSMSYIRLISKLVTFQMRRRGMDIAVDSSGFSLKTSSKWFDIRIKRKSEKKDYLKLHIVIDVDTEIIWHFIATDWKDADAKQFKRLIRDLPRIHKAAGDKAYSSRVNCQAVADKGGSHSSVSRQTLRVRRWDIRHGKYHSRRIRTIQTNGWTNTT